MDKLIGQFNKLAVVSRSTLLRQVLEMQKNDHARAIINELTLKDAHVYCVINKLSAQQFGPLLERYIIRKFGFVKNDSKLANGDCRKLDANYEIKCSFGGTSFTKYNYVQIRLNHDIDYYLLSAFHLNADNADVEGELYLFKLAKINIKKLIAEYGSYAHGTISKLGEITIDDLNREDNSKEYAIRPKYGDPCWDALMEFRVNEDAL
jgi:hypothetical protein